MTTYASDEVQRVMDTAHAVYPLLAQAGAFPEETGLMALGLGILREIYACPNCPGRIRQRMPLAVDGIDRIYCPQCQVIWEYHPTAAEVAPSKCARKRKEK